MFAPRMPDTGEPALDFGGAVLLIVGMIPSGRVMTYGDVAAELGSRGARAVGRVMATEGSSVPWWRVVRADGRAPAGHESDAREHYRREGTPLRTIGDDDLGYRIDLGPARWIPHRDTLTPDRAHSSCGWRRSDSAQSGCECEKR